MRYHDHPVLIKPYQMYMLEQQPREAAACTCMFYCQFAFFLLDIFIGVIFDLLISARVQREEVIPNEPISWYHRYK